MPPNKCSNLSTKLWIAEQTGVSRNTAKKYMATFDASGLTFEQIDSLNDKELEDTFLEQLNNSLLKAGY